MLEPFVDVTLNALRAGRTVPPAALIVLTRVYAATGRDDIGHAIGVALGAAAVTGPLVASVAERADWLRLWVEASQLSEDPRMREAAAAAAEELAAACAPHAGTSFADRARAVRALLDASAVVGAQRFAPPAIDELERLVASAYVPGAGLHGRTAAESVAVALALLAAFEVSGRLAYPMLAEELMRTIAGDLAGLPPADGCDAARAYARLARLHADDGYRATAVLAPDADYVRDGAALLDALAAACESSQDAAAYALALTERADGS